MFIRYRMHKTLRALEKCFDAGHERGISGEALKPFLDAPSGSKILSALHDTGAIYVLNAENGIYSVHPGKGTLYHLDRQDVWTNRIIGFLSGVAITLIAEAVIRAIL